MNRPILLFGGSFDPPHRAHMVLAEHACAACRAECIIFIPAAQSPHKSSAPSASGAQRVQMLRMAIAESDIAALAGIDEQELHRAAPSYFIDTLRAIRTQHPERTLRFLIGADQALSFQAWRDPQEILLLAQPLIVLRPPHDRAAFLRLLREQAPQDSASQWEQWVIDAPFLPDASTDLRLILAEGRFDDAARHLSPSVLAFIRANDLYRAGGQRTQRGESG